MYSKVAMFSVFEQIPVSLKNLTKSETAPHFRGQYFKIGFDPSPQRSMKILFYLSTDLVTSDVDSDV